MTARPVPFPVNSGEGPLGPEACLAQTNAPPYKHQILFVETTGFHERQAAEQAAREARNAAARRAETAAKLDGF